MMNKRIQKRVKVVITVWFIWLVLILLYKLSMPTKVEVLKPTIKAKGDPISGDIASVAASSVEDMLKKEEEEKKKAEEEKKKKEAEAKKKAEAQKQRSFTTRLTSYWVNDECKSKDMTASGLYSKHFKLNDKGWYTYKGMLVVATASTRLGKTNMKTFKLYDQFTLVIKGKSYKAIVLDVCGYCMKYNRVDLYVIDGKHAPGGYATVIY